MLADAQLAVARQHGFASWRKLKSAVNDATRSLPAIAPGAPALDPELVRQFSEAFSRDRGDVVAIRALLDAHPELVHCQP